VAAVLADGVVLSEIRISNPKSIGGWQPARLTGGSFFFDTNPKFKIQNRIMSFSTRSPHCLAIRHKIGSKKGVVNEKDINIHPYDSRAGRDARNDPGKDPGPAL
jgi:hypothetical protein